MDIVKHVDINLFEIISLGILSVTDIKKREVSLIAMFGVILLFLYPEWRDHDVNLEGMMAGGILIGMSIVRNQMLGLADALILFCIATKYGSFTMFGILFLSLLLLLLFYLIRGAVMGKREVEYPFLPFLTVAYIIWE